MKTPTLFATRSAHCFASTIYIFPEGGHAEK